MPAAMAPRMTGLTAGLGCGRARAGGAQAGTARTAEEEGGGARSSRSSAPLREGGGRWWPCGSSPGRPEEAVAVEAGGGHGERARAGRVASSSGVRAGGGAAACGRAPTEREGRGEADGERGVGTPPELGVEEVAARPPRLQPRPGPPAAAQAHGRREEAPGGRGEEGAAPRGEGGGRRGLRAPPSPPWVWARVPPPLALRASRRRWQRARSPPPRAPAAGGDGTARGRGRKGGLGQLAAGRERRRREGGPGPCSPEREEAPREQGAPPARGRRRRRRDGGGRTGRERGVNNKKKIHVRADLAIHVDGQRLVSVPHQR